MLLLLPLGAVALQSWAWRSLRSRFLAGVVSKPAALVRYGGWALVPLLFWAGLLLGAVAAEELSGAAIISEPVGRATLPLAALLLAIAGLGWLSFWRHLPSSSARPRRGPSPSSPDRVE